MKIKTTDLTGPALDWAVAKCKGVKVEQIMGLSLWSSANWEQYSTDWSQGGPIIEREGISVFPMNTCAEGWCAHIHEHRTDGAIGKLTHKAYGPTPLIAVMRCFVASKLGDEVEIPEELL